MPQELKEYESGLRKRKDEALARRNEWKRGYNKAKETGSYKGLSEDECFCELIGAKGELSSHRKNLTSWRTENKDSDKAKVVRTYHSILSDRVDAARLDEKLAKKGYKSAMDNSADEDTVRELRNQFFIASAKLTAHRQDLDALYELFPGLQ